MELKELQNAVKKWTNYNFPDAEKWQPLVGVMEELGELSHAHLKMHQQIRGTKEEHIDRKTDAIGDIIIFLADYANRNDLDLDFCVDWAWREASQRDWIKYTKNGVTE